MHSTALLASCLTYLYYSWPGVQFYVPNLRFEYFYVRKIRIKTLTCQCHTGPRPMQAIAIIGKGKRWHQVFFVEKLRNELIASNNHKTNLSKFQIHCSPLLGNKQQSKWCLQLEHDFFRNGYISPSNCFKMLKVFPCRNMSFALTS